MKTILDTTSAEADLLAQALEALRTIAEADTVRPPNASEMDAEALAKWTTYGKLAKIAQAVLAQTPTPFR
jgi:hypothetical protein